MNSSFKVESGVQLLARLTRRPSLSRLWPRLLPSQFPSGSVLEVSGASGAGKSLLMVDAVCQALLPRQCGGCGAGVLIFNTDGNLNLSWLSASLRERMEETVSNKNYTKLDLLEKGMSEALHNLLVGDVYDSMQLLISIENLEIILTDNPNISLIVIDTLTAFYWSDQGAKLQRMDSYLKNLLRKIQKVTKEHKVTVLYTKPQYFGSKQNGVENMDTCVKDPTLERVNCRIQVNKSDDSRDKNTFQVAINTCDERSINYFTINKHTIVWSLISNNQM